MLELCIIVADSACAITHVRTSNHPIVDVTITEFEAVGQPKMAWDVLKEQLNSKKHRSAWSSVHEKLMVKFIDLSIELQK